MTNILFFFQAEDGIRDLIVTGVQTCALPISDRERTLRRRTPTRRTCPEPARGRGRRADAPPAGRTPRKARAARRRRLPARWRTPAPPSRPPPAPREPPRGAAAPAARRRQPSRRRGAGGGSAPTPSWDGRSRLRRSRGARS